MMGPAFEIRDAIEACRVIGVDLESERFDAAALLSGMKVELEHGAPVGADRA